jgi:DNA-binding Lrp family transcriptional regulator
MTIDEIDRRLLAELQQDATQSYATLGQTVGLSAGAAHERVRKLRSAGVIRRTTIEVDPAALGSGVLAYVLLDTDSWMGDEATKQALGDISVAPPGGRRDQYSDSRRAGVLLRTAAHGDVTKNLSPLKRTSP